MASNCRVHMGSMDGMDLNYTLPVGSVLQTVWDSPTGRGAVWVKTADGEWTEKFTHAKAYPFPNWESALVLTHVPPYSK